MPRSIPNNLKIPPELTLPTPRRVCESEQSISGRRAAAIILLAILLIIFYFAYHEVYRIQILLKTGIETTATLLDKHESTGRTTTCDFDIAYRVGSDNITGEKDVDSETYDRTDVGDKLTITYLPQSPDDFEFGQVTTQTIAETKHGAFLVCVIAAIILLGILAGSEQTARTRIKLLSEGSVAIGEVKSMQKTVAQGSNARYYISVRYHASGSRKMKEFSVSRIDYQGLAIGDYVVVLYLSNRPSTCLLYGNITGAHIVC